VEDGIIERLQSEVIEWAGNCDFEKAQGGESVIERAQVPDGPVEWLQLRGRLIAQMKTVIECLR
jgi:hypothetical protein